MDTQEKVCEIIKGLGVIDEIGLSQTLTGDIGLDSLGMVTLLIILENGFDISFKQSDMDPYALINVQDVIVLVEKYIGGENDG